MRVDDLAERRAIDAWQWLAAVPKGGRPPAYSPSTAAAHLDGMPGDPLLNIARRLTTSL
jgi:hypothetical protein